MNIVISDTTDVPIYQQIYEQIRSQIIRGEIPSGFCLPPIRTVSKELRISVITVKRAWEELEHDGYINTMVGRGCFVAPLPTEALDDKKSQLMQEKLTKDIKYYQSLGISMDELIDFIRRYYSQLT